MSGNTENVQESQKFNNTKRVKLKKVGFFFENFEKKIFLKNFGNVF
jgi:hypothetical protein